MKKLITSLLSHIPSIRSSIGRAYIVIILLVCTALFQKFIANDVPIMGIKAGEVCFPAFRDLGVDLGIAQWTNRYKYRNTESDYTFKITTPIPYSSTNIDQANAGFMSPLEKQEVSSWSRRHWLGTDQMGRDVMAGMVAGCRVALLVGFFTCLLALLIGIPLGLMAGYFGDHHLRLHGLSLLILALSLSAALYLTLFFKGVYLPLLLVISVSLIAIYLLERFAGSKGKMTIPIDSIVLRIIEIFKSIPALIIIFVLLGILSSHSIWNIVLCLGLVLWFNIARYVRGELLSIRELDFISAQKSIGQHDIIIMVRHCLKMALPPVLVSVVFLFAGVILLESTLSFLGIGLPQESVSWGTMLRDARTYFPAWWMALFPGLAILISIMSLHAIAQHWIQRINVMKSGD